MKFHFTSHKIGYGFETKIAMQTRGFYFNHSYMVSKESNTNPLAQNKFYGWAKIVFQVIYAL